MRTKYFKPFILVALVVGLSALQAAAQFLNQTAQLGRNKVGSVTTGPGAGDYTIVGGGNDTWDQQDELTYQYTEICGDFDVQVRVESLTPNARWSKAGIMVRESLAEDSRDAFQRVAPLDVPTGNGGNGANDNAFIYRTGLFNNASDNGGQHEDGGGLTYAANPWVRLVRVGSVFSGYGGPDGINWTQTGASQDTANWNGGAFKNKVLLGLSCSRHSGDGAHLTATAVFHDFQLTLDPRFCFCSASSLGCENKIRLCFNKPVGADALVLASYDLAGDGPVLVSASAGPTGETVDLMTDIPMTEGAGYTVTVLSEIHDSQGNAIDPSCVTVTFIHAEGYELRKIHVQHNQNAIGENYYAFEGSLAHDLGIGVACEERPGMETGKLDGGTGKIAFEDPTTDDGSHERYSSRIIAIIKPPTDGDYQFASTSDDQGHLFLSSDDKPAHKRVITFEPQWGTSRGYGSTDRRDPTLPENRSNGRTGPFALLANNQYYLEYTYTEGGGGNNGSATWDLDPTDLTRTAHLPGFTDGMLPILEDDCVASRFHAGQIFYNLGPVSITKDLPTDLTVKIGDTATFELCLDGAPPYTVAWKVNGTTVASGSSTVYSITGIVASDDGKVISAMVKNAWGMATSVNCKLHVLKNPVKTGLASRGNCHKIYVTYNKPMTTIGTYTVDGGITVTAVAIGATPNEVVLSVTPDLVSDTDYTVTITGAKDSVDNLVIDPNPTIMTFTHGIEYPSFRILYTKYNGTGNGNIANAESDPKVAGEHPDIIRTTFALFETPSNIDDNFTDKLRGIFVAAVEGDYRFWMSCDDQGRMYISEDAIPAHKHQIAYEPAWGQVRGWADAGHDANDNRGVPPVNGSDPIHLIAGQEVYLELVHTEGGGGDNSAATFTVDDATVPANGTAPISADQFSARRISPLGTTFTTLCDVFIVAQPVCPDPVRVGQKITFKVAVDGTPEYSYQWSKNGVNIPGANSASYTTDPTTLTSDTDVYRVRINNAFSSVLSAAVSPCLNRAPLIVKCFSHCGIDKVHVRYNKPVKLDGTYAVEDSSAVAVAVNGISYGSSHSEVILDTDFLLADEFFKLTVSGVTDEETPTHALDPDPSFCYWQNGPGTFKYDFSDGDGLIPPGTVSRGSAPPAEDGGVLKLTHNGATGQVNYWGVPAGPFALVHDTLHASWEQHIHGSIGNFADGMSFNAGVSSLFGGNYLPEGGANNGLIVTVDTFDNGGGESGIYAKYNGARLGFTQIGGGNGPAQLDNGLDQWVNAVVDLSSSGHITFNYGTYSVEGQIPDYAGVSIDMYEFAARTGGASEDCWIRNLKINAESSERLSISLDPGTGKVTVSWTADACKLQCTTELNSDPTLTVWTDVATTSPYVTTPSGKRFYRLVVD